MPSLKEIKERITSIKSTQKITSAMKMLASSKLKKAQYQMNCFLPYQRKLNAMLNSFLFCITDFKSDLTKKREIKRIALVIFSSNTSLCGTFNSNIIKLFNETISKYRYLNQKDIEVYTVGKKIEDYVRKLTFPLKVEGNHTQLIEKPNFARLKQLADKLLSDFLNQKIDKVELLYNHCKNAIFQTTNLEPYLPIQMKQPKSTSHADYIIEPDKDTVLNTLILRSLYSKIYAVLLNSVIAEHTARLVSMQIAIDNADEILEELTIQHNKQRQQTITNDLLDIISSSEALK
ncbi:MAG: F0F1 ATP synthase subunit gamma [Candidatus Azobacteroides pseudotrichonymphae]|jgi:F-type H+-transporting ATPase subunit gamma|nr:F0F1 ATP synthase subunit gamma [Bacteroidales bacterium OttesenSCG-928-I14]GMO32262.1 MAG: F0F1 ATP synthase subunit gamma [Candidatus Azobacteroides pseudotrichonymphae]